MNKYKVLIAILLSLYLFLNARASEPQLGPVQKQIVQSALEYDVDPIILLAICWVESGHVATKVNHSDPTGAYGVCQVLKSTADWLADKSVPKRKLLNAKYNSSLAAKYFDYQYKRYNNYYYAVAAYNSGSIKFNSEGKLINEAYIIKVIKAAILEPWLIRSPK